MYYCHNQAKFTFKICISWCHSVVHKHACMYITATPNYLLHYKTCRNICMYAYTFLFGVAFSVGAHNTFKKDWMKLINPFNPEFMVWTLPSLILNTSILRIGMSAINQEQNGKQCRSRWDGLFQAISSGSTRFAKICFWSARLKGLREIHFMP